MFSYILRLVSKKKKFTQTRFDHKWNPQCIFSGISFRGPGFQGSTHIHYSSPAFFFFFQPWQKPAFFSAPSRNSHNLPVRMLADNSIHTITHSTNNVFHTFQCDHIWNILLKSMFMFTNKTRFGWQNMIIFRGSPFSTPQRNMQFSAHQN